MKKNRLTKLEIIEETVKFYSEDPSRRSIIKKPGFAQECVYNGPNNTHCAVGRCLLSKYKRQGQHFSFNVGYNVGCFYTDNKNIDLFLSLKYRGHSRRFWSDLQSFHDRNMYFSITGLSELGKNYVKELKERYAE